MKKTPKEVEDIIMNLYVNTIPNQSVSHIAYLTKLSPNTVWKVVSRHNKHGKIGKATASLTPAEQEVMNKFHKSK